MKPLHIVVLLAAGAIGGAVIMKVALKPQTAAPAPVVRTGTNAAGDRAGRACHGTGGCASHGASPANPSPFEPAKPRTPSAGRAANGALRRAEPKPQAVAARRNQPVATAAPAAAPPAPGPTEPAPQPVPPARLEPEHVTPPPRPPLRPSPTGLR